MTKCKGCGNPYRIGRSMHLLREDGSIIPIIGCQNCAKRAVKVISPAGETKHLCKSCDREPARICTTCAVKARMQLVAPILAQLNALALAAESMCQQERADGIRTGIRALQQEAERG